MFVHIHHVRVARLETSAPGLFDDLIKFDKTDKAQDKKRLRRALERSGEAMAAFIEMGLAAGKIKGFKLHPISFVDYLIAHEAYHRGEICVALTESGRRLDNDVLYGQWEWEKR